MPNSLSIIYDVSVVHNDLCSLNIFIEYTTSLVTCLGGSGHWDAVHTDQDSLSKERGSIPRVGR